MAITFGTPATQTATGTTLSMSIDAGSASNRVLYVGLRIPSNRTITEITYGGNAMTLVGQAGASNQARLFRLVAPPTGTNTFSLTTGGSGSDSLRAVGVVAIGVDQTDPDDAAVAQEVTDTAADQSTNVTTEAGDVVISFGVVSHSSSGGSITSLNTSLADIDNSTVSAGMGHGSGSSPVSMGWSFTGDGGAGADFWQVATNLNQHVGGDVLTVESGSGVGEGSQVNLLASGSVVMPVTAADGVGEPQHVFFLYTVPGTSGTGIGQGSDISAIFQNSFTLVIDAGSGVGAGENVALLAGANITLLIEYAQAVGAGQAIALFASATLPGGRPPRCPRCRGPRRVGGRR